MARLKQMLEEHGVTQADLARLLGRDRAVITNLMHGRRMLKAEEAVTIANYLGVAVTEILGVEEFSGSLAEPQHIPFQHAPSVQARATRHVVKKKGAYFLETESPSSPKSFALEVRDDSLNLSGFMPGDIVISELDKEVREGDIAIVQHYAEEDAAHTLLRRYQPPLLLPHSTNPTHLPLKAKDASLRIVSPVVKLLRFF